MLKEENKGQINKTSNTEFKEANKSNDKVKMDNASTGKRLINLCLEQDLIIMGLRNI